MTREEFYARYGDVELTFSSYYKYTFTYTATLPDGRYLEVLCGGNSDDIYLSKVHYCSVETVLSLQPYSGCVYLGAEKMESFYDY